MMDKLNRRILTTMLLAGLAQFTFATDYTQYCPLVSQLKPVEIGTSVSYYYAGTNADNVSLKADIDQPQFIFTMNQAPQPKSIDSNLTTFIAVSNTLRCNYVMTNASGYPVNYPLYNHGSYQECPNGNLVLAGNPC